MKPGLTRYLVAAFSAAALFTSDAASTTALPVEIRFCRAPAVRTYPLESRREIQSLLLQNVAVINHGNARLRSTISIWSCCNRIVWSLQSNRVVELRKLGLEAIQRIADRSAKVQATGILQQVAFQFCGTDLIPPSIKLAGPILDRDRALPYHIAGTRVQRRTRYVARSRAWRC